MMNVKFLSKDELYQLANIVYECSKRSEEASSALGNVSVSIHGQSEDVSAFVWDRIGSEHT